MNNTQINVATLLVLLSFLAGNYFGIKIILAWHLRETGPIKIVGRKWLELTKQENKKQAEVIDYQQRMLQVYEKQLYMLKDKLTEMENANMAMRQHLYLATTALQDLQNKGNELKK